MKWGMNGHGEMIELRGREKMGTNLQFEAVGSAFLAAFVYHGLSSSSIGHVCCSGPER